jgi:putative SOS response-associated peptidase YedK
MASIHNRMPVILPEAAYPLWLEAGEQDVSRFTELLKPFPSEQMQAYPVSPLVNNPKNDIPSLIEPTR